MEEVVNRLNFAKRMAKQLNKPVSETKEYVDILFKLLEESLINHEEVSISSIGKFRVKKHDSFLGFDPINKVPKKVEEHYRLHFTPSIRLKKRIKRNTEEQV